MDTIIQAITNDCPQVAQKHIESNVGHFWHIYGRRQGPQASKGRVDVLTPSSNFLKSMLILRKVTESLLFSPSVLNLSSQLSL